MATWTRHTQICVVNKTHTLVEGGALRLDGLGLQRNTLNHEVTAPRGQQRTPLLHGVLNRHVEYV